MRFFLMVLILLAMARVAVADTVSVIHVKRLDGNSSITKIVGKLLDEAPKSCESDVALLFENEKGFFGEVYMSVEVADFQALKNSIKLGPIFHEGDTIIKFCVPEVLFKNTSFDEGARIVQGIFLWSPSDIPLARGYMKDLEGTNSSVTTKESVLTDPIFWLLMLVLAVLAGYEFKNYKERQRRLKRKK